MVGVPILDRADDLAIKMLARIVPPNIRIESMATVMLTSELLNRLESEEPDVVCVSALGPGGVGQVRYVCKRVRQSFPTLPIVVGRWAYRGNTERMISNTKERGATSVVSALELAMNALMKVTPRIPQNVQAVVR